MFMLAVAIKRGYEARAASTAMLPCQALGFYFHERREETAAVPSLRLERNKRRDLPIYNRPSAS
jgi:hypothetical protein